MKHLACVGIFAQLLLTSGFGQNLFSLTFDSPPHSVGGPVATGVPGVAPSSRNFGTSVVVPTFAGADNPAMQFVPTNVPGSSFSYSQYSFDLTPYTQFSRYRVEFDLVLSNFQTDGGPFSTTPGEDYFSLLFDVPNSIRLDFTDLGFILQKESDIGSFQFGQAMHIIAEVDLAQNQWGIIKDDVGLFQGQFHYPYPAHPDIPTSIRSIRLNLADSMAFSGSPIAVIDNFRIQVPEPSASWLVFSGVMLLLARPLAFQKHPVRGR